LLQLPSTETVLRSHLFPKIEFGLVKPRLAIMDALSGPPTAEEEAAIVESITPGIQALHPVLIALEQMMGNGPYAVGRRMTAADCMLYPPLADLLAVKEGEILDGYIRISAWLNFFRSTSVAGDTKEGTLEVGGRP
jgi:glutathione S-transferase